jgi:cyclase
LSFVDFDTLDVGTHPTRVDLAHDVAAFVQLDGGWGLSNAGLVRSSDAVILIDTWFTERRNRILRDLVSGSAGRAPTLLLNTHHHGDHVFGNGWFPEAVIVSHETTREAVCALDPGVSARRFTTVEFGEARPTPATVTFADELTIHAGDMTLEVFFPGLAHCAGNIAIYVAERSVLFAGDILLKKCTPTLVGGSALGYLSVLERLRGLDAEHVVPGHGRICSSTVIDETERYLQFLLELAADAIVHDLSPLEAARASELGEFEPWLDSERIVGNLYRAMHELAPDLFSTGLDMHAMWRDTEDLLGRPLHSRA